MRNIKHHEIKIYEQENHVGDVYKHPDGKVVFRIHTRYLSIPQMESILDTMKDFIIPVG